MKNRCSLQILPGLVVTALTLLLAPPGYALIIGPYTTDTGTLHLWHLDEAATPCVDAVSTGGTNLTVLGGGATLNNAGFSGFGTALSTIDGGAAGTNNAGLIDAHLSPRTLVNAVGDNVAWSFADPASGAFTFEALVYIAFDPATNLGTVANGGSGRNTPMHIIAGEQDSTGGGIRSWQFRLDPVGFVPNADGFTTPLTQPAIEFINVNNGTAVQNLVASIPTTGDDAILSNKWYHVAVTYNGAQGTADNLRIYWTLMDGTRTAATQLSSRQLNLDLNASGAVDLCIGNLGRNPPNGNFIGLVDEVRISKIARGAGAMMFAAPIIGFDVNPSNMVVAVSQPATLTVAASGVPPLSYQWRHAGTNLPGATSTSYTIAAATFDDAGDYDVVVTNLVAPSATSAIGVLTVRIPTNLVWGVGAASPAWNTADVNWDSDGDGGADLAFTPGDHVRFDDVGIGSSFVNFPGEVTPSSVVVSNATGDYTFTTFATGFIGSNARLTKDGAGKLTIDVDNVNSGGTTIKNGVVEIGFGAGRGAIGSGAITNQGGLVYYRTGTVTVTNTLAGAGGLTNNANAALFFSGTNDFTGDVHLNAGSLTLSGAPAKINSTNINLVASANTAGATRFSFSGGVTFAPDVVFSLLGTTVSPDTRCTINSANSNNVINGPIVITGDGIAQFWPDADVLTVNSVVNSPSFSGKLIVRGNGNGIWNGQVQTGGHFSKTDGGMWTLNSTGNSWTNTDIAGGLLRLGANNAIVTTATVNMTGGSLDLAGFNQQVAVLNATSGPIGNSSTTDDSLLTIVNNTNYAGVIQDSISNGTRKVSLTIAGGTVSLSGISTFTGDTLVSSGTLVLSNAGSLNGTAHLNVVGGATLNVAGRTSGTPGIAAATTLMGNGTITGNLTNAGTVSPGASIGTLTFANHLALASGSTTYLEVDKGNSTKDQLIVTGTMVYGGTLFATNLSGTLNLGDSFTVVTAGLAAGNFASITGSPGGGNAWSFNPASGVLSVVAGVATNPTNITASVVNGGTQYDLSWPEDHRGWTLESNSVGIASGSSWYPVANSTATNRVILNIEPGTPQVYFRLLYVLP